MGDIIIPNIIQAITQDNVLHIIYDNILNNVPRDVLGRCHAAADVNFENLPSTAYAIEGR